LESDISDLKGIAYKLEKSEARNEELKHKLLGQEEVHQNILARYHSLEREKEKLYIREEYVGKLEKEIEELKAQIANQNSIQAKVQEQNVSLESLLRTRYEQIQLLEQQLNDLQQKAANYAKEKESIKADIDKYLAKIDSILY
jgi:chromosome segregation ATPase